MKLSPFYLLIFILILTSCRGQSNKKPGPSKAPITSNQAPFTFNKPSNSDDIAPPSRRPSASADTNTNPPPAAAYNPSPMPPQTNYNNSAPSLPPSAIAPPAPSNQDLSSLNPSSSSQAPSNPPPEAIAQPSSPSAPSVGPQAGLEQNTNSAPASNSSSSSNPSGENASPATPSRPSTPIPSNLSDMIQDTDPNICPSVTRNRKKVDLRPELGIQRHQDGTGWCYAFAAAELMTQYLQRTKGECLDPPQNLDFTQTDNMVSAASLAANNSYVMQKENSTQGRSRPLEMMSGYRADYTFLTGGSSSEVIRDAFGQNPRYPNMRFCLEGQLRSESYLFNGDPKEEYTAYCENLFPEWKKLTNQMMSLVEKIQMLPTEAQSFCKMKLKSSCKPNVVDKCVENPALVAEKARISSPPEGYSYRAFSFCGEHSQTVSSHDELMREVDQALDMGRMVQTSYNNSNFKSMNMLNISREPNTHATVIVGRQINPQTCKIEYILRDSMSLSCRTFNNTSPGQQQGHLRCEKDARGRGIVIYVEESAFRKHLNTISYIDNL